MIFLIYFGGNVDFRETNVNITGSLNVTLNIFKLELNCSGLKFPATMTSTLECPIEGEEGWNNLEG